MKMALPTRKDCKYIKNKLKIFYYANLNHKFRPEEQKVQFDRALIRLFKFFQLSVPSIEWYNGLGEEDGCKILGRCTEDGIIKLLTPNKHGTSFEEWLDTVYHEVGHYVLWAECEKKAREFARRMRNR